MWSMSGFWRTQTHMHAQLYTIIILELTVFESKMFSLFPIKIGIHCMRLFTWKKFTNENCIERSYDFDAVGSNWHRVRVSRRCQYRIESSFRKTCIFLYILYHTGILIWFVDTVADVHDFWIHRIDLEVLLLCWEQVNCDLQHIHRQLFIFGWFCRASPPPKQKITQNR